MIVNAQTVLTIVVVSIAIITTARTAAATDIASLKE